MLTNRQKEFLQAAYRLWLHKGREGVHYSEVATSLGVSKWTAYDVLTNLSRKGLLHVTHEPAVPPGGPGRSRVLFSPSNKARKIIAKAAGLVAGEGERLRSLIRERVEQGKARGSLQVLKEILSELEHSQQPIIFCAYVVGIAILALEFLAQNAEWAGIISYCQQILLSPQAALIAFVSVVVAAGARHEEFSETFREVIKYLPAYEAQAQELDADKRKLLAHCAREIIEELWPLGVKAVRESG